MGEKSDPKPQTLHPVYTVTNIQHKVPPLDGKEVTYPTWVKLFKLHATGYDVLHHIDGSPPPDKTSTEYQSWKKIDAVVLQWIYGTLHHDLLVRVLEDQSTAFEAWERVKNLFLNNKGPRAAALQHELTNLTLSAMPNLEAYCQRIRELADQLTAVDCPINNTQRIIYLARGLPREYDVIASTLNQSLPPWESAIEQLQSEARRIAARDALSPTPIVAATITPPPENYTNRDNSRNSHPRRNHNTREQHPRREPQRNNRFNPKNGQNQFQPRGHSTYPNQVAPYWTNQPQYPPFWAPPPCPFPTQAWAQPWASTYSRPTNNQTAQTRNTSAQAHLTETNLLEPTQLANAVHALSINSGDDPWHLDTGASSHVTYDPGFQGWHDPESSQQHK